MALEYMTQSFPRFYHCWYYIVTTGFCLIIYRLHVIQRLSTLVSPTSEPSPTLPHVSREVATLPGWHSGYDNGLPLCVGCTLHCASRRRLLSRRVSEGLESPRVKLSAELENVPSTRFPEPGLSPSVDGLIDPAAAVVPGSSLSWSSVQCTLIYATTPLRSSQLI